MPTPYPNTVRSEQIGPRTGHPDRKVLTCPQSESGRAPSDLLVAVVIAAAPWVAITTALTLAELLPSWIVILMLALGGVGLVLRPYAKEFTCASPLRASWASPRPLTLSASSRPFSGSAAPVPRREERAPAAAGHLPGTSKGSAGPASPTTSASRPSALVTQRSSPVEPHGTSRAPDDGTLVVRGGR